jgi:uncharacterized membrane protein YgdD (TMEM256/DUF423 family)
MNCCGPRPQPIPSFFMSPRIWIVLGSLSAAVAVGWGAFHAHGMESLLKARGINASDLNLAMHSFDVAVRYQAMHGIAIILVGIVGLHSRTLWLDVAASMFALGTLLFSACLETSILLEVKLPWFLVPCGGLAFIAGWIVLAIGSVAGGVRKKEAPCESGI